MSIFASPLRMKVHERKYVHDAVSNRKYIFMRGSSSVIHNSVPMT